MEIELVGLLTDEDSKRLAASGVPHVVCGVDVYEKQKLGEKPVKVDRHYRLINARDTEDYNPLSTIAEVREALKALGIGKVNTIGRPDPRIVGHCTDVVETEDSESKYVLTALTEAEEAELLKKDI